jgi:hypothetical protein
MQLEKALWRITVIWYLGGWYISLEVPRLTDLWFGEILRVSNGNMLYQKNKQDDE